MKRMMVSFLALGALILFVASAPSQPGRDKGDKKEGPAGGPPPRFQLGNLFPPHLKQELKLTREQEKQLSDLEREVKEKLEKILTPEQKSVIEKARPPRGPGGPGGNPGERPEKQKGDRPDSKQVKTDAPNGGIQWYATWESGLREAQRSGLPILFVSAAPHCAGVSGTW